MKVQVQIAREDLKQYKLPDDVLFEHWANATVSLDTEVVVRVVDETESAALNGKYRHLHNSTNVLAFPYEPVSHEEQPYLGDIVIAAPLVCSEAEQRGINPRAHWAHLFVHAILHLVGYDHQTPDEATRMQARETEVLTGLNIASPWLET